MPANYYIHNIYRESGNINAAFGEAKIQQQVQYMHNQIDALVKKYETELQQKLGILTGSSKVLDQMESTIKLAANEMQQNLPEIVRINFEAAIDAALNANSASELSNALQKAQAEIDKIEEIIASFEDSYNIVKNSKYAQVRQVYIDNKTTLDKKYNELMSGKQSSVAQSIKSYLRQGRMDQKLATDLKHMYSGATAGIMAASGFLSEGLFTNVLNELFEKNLLGGVKASAIGTGARSGYTTNASGKKVGYKNMTSDISAVLTDTSGTITVSLPGITLKRTGQIQIDNATQQAYYTVHVKSSSIGQILDTADIADSDLTHFYNLYANSGRAAKIVQNNDGTIGEIYQHPSWNLNQVYKWAYTSMILSSMMGNLTSSDFAYFLVINNQVYTMPKVLTAILNGSASFGKSNYPKSFANYLENPAQSDLAKFQPSIAQQHSQIFDELLSNNKSQSMRALAQQRSNKVMRLMYDTSMMKASLSLRIGLNELI